MHKREPHSGPARTALRTGALAAAALMGAAGLAAPASADAPGPVVEDGRTQPVFDYADAVYQEVDIVTGADSDGDGEPDTVRMRIMRPEETEDGLQVPTILEPSPYWAGTHDAQMYDVDLDDDSAGTVPRGRPRAGSAEEMAQASAEGPRGASAQAGPTGDGSATMPNYYDNYFLPRGYAVAQLDSLGTGGSTGCPTSGGENETQGVTAAVDWLNGRTTGFDAETGEEVSAEDWSTGNVAMTGISYNGTLPVAAASTGVEGLRTIVPQGAISSWYDYYRDNGGVVAPGGYQGEDADVLAKLVYTRADADVCDPVIDGVTEGQDRDSGDYNDWWDERNYRNDAEDGAFGASVFLAHGLNDWNVKTDQAMLLWQALEDQGVERKMWLHQAGHVNPFNLRMDEWLDQLHRWFDHELYGVDNGIMDEPRVDVQGSDTEWAAQDDWPGEGTAPVRLGLRPGGEDGDGGLEPGKHRGKPRWEEFTDEGRGTPAEELVAEPGTGKDGALVYRTGELTEDVRMSGVPEVTVRAAMDGSSPYLTALLVDYGTDTRPTEDVRYDTDDRVCYGEGVPEDPGCTYPSYNVTEESDFKIVTRGWIDARNRGSDEEQRPVVTDKPYRYTWPMQAQDYVFKKGHRIGVVLVSTDHDYTLRYPAGTEVEVDTKRTSITLPVSEGGGGLG
ncbi:Xaa-Pro dipeptidyl-peptidase [Nocardiopsis sp. RSe5-2]|uniref:Xaa-Pro dipeptidyl-peptidase n=1 Tax=Nocardiopsis endophytica TaxID=3018445 RepID=A0ABT4UCC8_9ACTN|nr:Xaa-Pro dipeptidyl-peptidase [Nocardiopsis endophytica]MDA2814623.1 Xaa-Pro dipeptidyl-peptidase [Nocardiopsis endophytica]